MEVWLFEESVQHYNIWAPTAKNRWRVAYFKDRRWEQNWTRVTNVFPTNEGINAPEVYVGSRFFEISRDDVFVHVL